MDIQLRARLSANTRCAFCHGPPSEPVLCAFCATMVCSVCSDEGCPTLGCEELKAFVAYDPKAALRRSWRRRFLVRRLFQATLAATFLCVVGMSVMIELCGLDWTLAMFFPNEEALLARSSVAGSIDEQSPRSEIGTSSSSSTAEISPRVSARVLRPANLQIDWEANVLRLRFHPSEVTLTELRERIRRGSVIIHREVRGDGGRQVTLVRFQDIYVSEVPNRFPPSNSRLNAAGYDSSGLNVCEWVHARRRVVDGRDMLEVRLTSIQGGRPNMISPGIYALRVDEYLVVEMDLVKR